jgi:hypothetical protein
MLFRVSEEAAQANAFPYGLVHTCCSCSDGTDRPPRGLASKALRQGWIGEDSHLPYGCRNDNQADLHSTD